MFLFIIPPCHKPIFVRKRRFTFYKPVPHLLSPYRVFYKRSPTTQGISCSWTFTSHHEASQRECFPGNTTLTPTNSGDLRARYTCGEFRAGHGPPQSAPVQIGGMATEADTPSKLTDKKGKKRTKKEAETRGEAISTKSVREWDDFDKARAKTSTSWPPP